MIAPGQIRPSKPYRGGVIQVHVTRACDKACFNCTQLSNLRGPYTFMTVSQFEQAVLSLKGYFGVVGMFGGNPATHPEFSALCEIMRRHVLFEQRGLWSNNPINLENAKAMRETFNPVVSNLNVHLDRKAFDLFKEGWPESLPFGLEQDSRHSPPWVAMKDVVKKNCPTCVGRGHVAYEDDCGAGEQSCGLCLGSGKVSDDSRIWELISNCDINQHWSAMIGVFRGELRAYFCEVAGAQAMIHQDEPGYQDTGLDPRLRFGFDSMDGDLCARSTDQGDFIEWWKLPMVAFTDQVRFHCFRCGVPLRGRGELAQSVAESSREQVSAEHEAAYLPKRPGRRVEVVTDLVQLGPALPMMTKYLQNSAL
jgi:hypothetical protein